MTRSTARVVCTGVGLCSVAGHTLKELWDTLLAAPGTLVIPLPPAGDIPLPVGFAAALPSFTPDELAPSLARRLDRSTQLGLTAALRAFREARGEELPGDECGMTVGSGVGGLASLLENHDIARTTPRQVRPYAMPMALPGATAAEAAMLLSWRGPCLAYSTACAAGAHAIGEGFRLVRDGYARAVLCGGAEGAITPLAMFGFGRMGALATNIDDPTRSCRPFDRDRGGMVMGEGAAFLVLENADSARERGAAHYGEVLGYAATNDAYHVVAPEPDGDGARRCLTAALADAGVAPGEVTQVNAHGTATIRNDVAEAAALAAVFAGRSVPLTAVKGVTGHLFGASGALEAVVALRQAVTGIVPPTANFTETEIEGLAPAVSAGVRDTDPGVVVSNSFAFGGHNAVLVIGPGAAGDRRSE